LPLDGKKNKLANLLNVPFQRENGKSFISTLEYYYEVYLTQGFRALVEKLRLDIFQNLET